MILRKMIIAGAVTVLLVSSAFSEEKSETSLFLTVSDAVEMAIQNNLSIKQSKNSLDLLKKQKNFSWNSISPTASVTGSFQAPLESDTYSYSVTGSLNLNLSPSLATSIKGAKLSYENGELSYEKAVRSVELSVRKTFYSLLYAKENIALQLRSMETSKSTFESNLSKYNKGQLAQLDLLTSQYTYESKKPVVNSLISSYENNLDGFKQILGIDLSSKLELSGTLSDAIDIELSEEILHQSLDDVPDIKTARQNILIAKNNLMATRFAAWGPTLTLGYTYGKNGSFGDFGAPMGNISFADSLKDDHLKTTNNLSLNLRIPLDGYLPWSTGALSIENQKNNLKNLEMQLENTLTTTQINIRNSYNTIGNAQAQYKIYVANVELMQRTYDMTLEAYNSGSRDYLTLQRAEDNLLTAKTTLQQQTFTLISAVLDLENILGLEFGTISNQ